MAIHIAERCPVCASTTVNVTLLTTYAGYFECLSCSHHWREPAAVVSARLTHDPVAKDAEPAAR
jgi:hypothetical protein